MVFEHDSYRSFLREQLAKSIQENPAYSLRSFARRLGLSPSSVSEILNGRRDLSRDRALDLAQKMGLDPTEAEYFALLVQRESSKSAAAKEAALSRLQEMNPRHKYRDLGVDQFRLFSEWYHCVLFELIGLGEKDQRPHVLARRVGISGPEVVQALERLERLGLIHKTGAGFYEKTTADIIVSSKIPDEALRHFHTQMLDKTKAALVEQDTKERVVYTETFAFDSHQMIALNRLVEEFFEKVKLLSNKGKKKQEVYHLSTHCFRLTNRKGS